MENPTNGIVISEATLIAFLAGQTARHDRSCASLDNLVATVASLAGRVLELEAERQARPAPAPSAAEAAEAEVRVLEASARKAELEARIEEAKAAKAQAHAKAAAEAARWARHERDMAALSNGSHP